MGCNSLITKAFTPVNYSSILLNQLLLGFSKFSKHIKSFCHRLMAIKQIGVLFKDVYNISILEIIRKLLCSVE